MTETTTQNDSSIPLQMLFWGVAVGSAGLFLMDSRAVLTIGAIIAIGGVVKLAVRAVEASSQIQRVLNALTVLLIGVVVFWNGIDSESYTLILGGIALAGMAGSLLLSNHGRLVGSSVGTLIFGVLSVRYGLHGDWLIAAALLLFMVLFGRMSIKEWNVRGDNETA
jgi:hypothetical protein